MSLSKDVLLNRPQVLDRKSGAFDDVEDEQVSLVRGRRQLFDQITEHWSPENRAAVEPAFKRSLSRPHLAVREEFSEYLRRDLNTVGL